MEPIALPDTVNEGLMVRTRTSELLRIATAGTVAEVIAEVAATRITERGQTRADDRTSEAAMEDRKREGYF